MKIALRQPCIKYKPSFKREDLDKVKLTHTNSSDSIKREKKTPVFDDKGGVEALLHVIECFIKAIKYIKIETGAEAFSKFEEVLLRWCLSIEDFAPRFVYFPGKDNAIADCFSRLPRMDKPSEGKSAAKIAKHGKLIAFDSLRVPKLPEEEYSYQEDVVLPPSVEEIARTMPCLFSCCRDDPVVDDEMLESFLNHPPLQEMENPLSLNNIQTKQLQDVNLLAQRARNQARFPIETINGRMLICFQESPDRWVIALPAAMVDDTIRWYRKVLGHCGNEKLHQTIRERFNVPGLWKRCSQFQCNTCQLNKQVGAGYGHLPPREANAAPWSEVAADLIGPWAITLQDGREVKFNALTCIDLATNLVEMVRLKNKTSSHVSQQFENIWLNRYPKPNRCIHDNGGEFKGEEWLSLLCQADVDNKPTTPRNPQANAVCERMHQTVGNIIQTTFNDGRIRPATLGVANEAVDNALSTAMHIMRCAVSKALATNTPGSLAFHRDMLLDIPIIADLETIRNNRKLLLI